MKKIISLYSMNLLMLNLLVINWIIASNETPQNILLLNSYNQGYTWTDSITSGVIKTSKKFPSISLHIKYLNAKKFGQSKFEIEKKYLQEKYCGTNFQGIIVSDNDALDFVIKYKKELFPNSPIVYVGVSNPEDYDFEDSNIYGFEENLYIERNLELVRKIIPGIKKILVITDNTTTGKIIHELIDRYLGSRDSIKIEYPQKINRDSILAMSANPKYDAIFYYNVSKDENEELIKNEDLFKSIRLVSKVPIFYDDITFLGKGCLGGLFNNGAIHGSDALILLMKILESKNKSEFRHIYMGDNQYFFDQKELDRFNIPDKLLPKGAYIINKQETLSAKYYFIFTGILSFLSFIVVVLIVVNRRQKILQLKSIRQLELIEMQKDELQEAYKKLRELISELELSNLRLNTSNIELQEAKIKAEESDKLKSAFLANVSHEIRTPLNSIVGFSSLLVEDELDGHTRKTYSELIESNTTSLLVLIDEIIDLSKIEAQQLSLKMQEFSIDLLFSELYQMFSLNQKNHNIQLLIRKISENQELYVNSDRVRVKQILINLLSNAYKFTDFGIIEFGSLLSDQGELILFVKDTGIGIDKDFHQAIFQRFRKLNEAKNKRIYRGTGLGLAITQKLVELLGGRIWVESHPGVGSVFYFTLSNLVLKNK